MERISEEENILRVTLRHYLETIDIRLFADRLSCKISYLILIAHFVISDITYVTFFIHKEEMHSCLPLNEFVFIKHFI